MRTTMAMVFDGLSKKFACIKGQYYNPDTVVLSVYAFQQLDDIVCNNGAIVLRGCPSGGNASRPIQLSLKRAIEVYALGEAPSGQCSFSIIADASVHEVIHAAEDVLCEYRFWSNELASSVLGEASIAELVDKAHSLLGNPIIVLDRALRVRACTANDAMDDEMWTPLDSRAEVFAEPADAPGFTDFLKNFEKSKIVSNYVMFNGNHLASCRTRRIGDDFLFICLIQKNRQISESDIELLQVLCAMIEITLKTRQEEVSQEGIGYNGLLIDALEGRLANSVELANRMNILGYRLKPKIRILATMPQKGHLNDRQAHRLLNDISNTFPFGRCIYHGGILVSFASYGAGEGPKMSDFKKFERFLDKSSLISGVSEEYSSDTPLQEIYQTALSALNIGHRAFPGSRLLFFGDCRPYYLYEACFREGEVDFYVHPALRILASYDEKSKPSLRKILKILVLNWGNRTKAAKELFVQRNTLQARIREIETLCGIDLSDSAVITHIHHSFVLEEYCGKSI